ncbi:MAG: O-antigen ligase family protein [Bacteroidales bacterium]|nr:O-antigen ligase family protein [Bacteroidales bacterium]
MRPNSSVSLVTRLGLLGLIFIPVVLRLELLPFVFLSYYGISAASFTPVLPTMPSYYIIIITVLYLIYDKKSYFLAKAIGFLLYFFVCSLFHFDLNEGLSWGLIVILISDMIKNKKDIQRLFYSYLIISIFLSLLFLIHKDSFITDYRISSTEEMERMGWINPNAFGAFITIGAILSVAHLTKMLKFEESKILNIICTFTIIITFLVLSLNASRGALLAFIIPSALMLLFSNVKLWTKILFILIAAGIFIVLLNNGIFELLIIRMQEESAETGGGRTTIWINKLVPFINDSNIFELIMGIGETATNKLGSNGGVSTHNDLVTAFIAYGFIGLILFIYLFIIYPITKSSPKIRLSIAIIMLYLLIEYCVLEPVFRGYIIVTMFYTFMLKYVLIVSNAKS